MAIVYSVPVCSATLSPSWPEGLNQGLTLTQAEPAEIPWPGTWNQTEKVSLSVAKPVTYTARKGGWSRFQACGNRSPGSEWWSFLRPRFLFTDSTAFKKPWFCLSLFQLDGIIRRIWTDINFGIRNEVTSRRSLKDNELTETGCGWGSQQWEVPIQHWEASQLGYTLEKQSWCWLALVSRIREQQRVRL